MTLNLQKGQALSLEKNQEGITNISLGVNWGMIPSTSFFGSKTSVDLDAVVTIYDENKVALDTCYFGQKKSKCGAIVHSGDDLSGDATADDNDNEVIKINLSKVNPKARYLGLILFSYRKQKFGTIPYIGCSVYNNSQAKEEKLASFKVNLDNNLAGKVAMLVGFCQKDANGIWEFKATGEGIDQASLESIVTSALKSI